MTTLDKVMEARKSVSSAMHDLKFESPEMDLAGKAFASVERLERRLRIERAEASGVDTSMVCRTRPCAVCMYMARCVKSPYFDPTSEEKHYWINDPWFEGEVCRCGQSSIAVEIQCCWCHKDGTKEKMEPTSNGQRVICRGCASDPQIG